MNQLVAGGAIVLAVGVGAGCSSAEKPQSKESRDIQSRALVIGNNAVAATVYKDLRPGTRWECSTDTGIPTLRLSREVDQKNAAGKLVRYTYTGKVESAKTDFCDRLQAGKADDDEDINMVSLERRVLEKIAGVKGGEESRFDALTLFERSNGGWVEEHGKAMDMLTDTALPDSDWLKLQQA